MRRRMRRRRRSRGGDREGDRGGPTTDDGGASANNPITSPMALD